MTRDRSIWASFVLVALVVFATATVAYRVGRHVEAEAHAHPSNAPIIGIDGAGHLISSLHWTDESNEFSKRQFTSGKYTLDVWKAHHCVEEE